MAYQLFNLPKSTPVNASSVVLAGSKLYFYATTTTTLQNTYSDSTLVTPNANPVVADSNGLFGAIYLNPTLQYKMTLTTSADVLVYTVDPVNDQVISAAVIGGYLYPRTASEIAASVTPTFYNYAPYNLKRYGALGDGSTDDSTAISNFFASIPTDGEGFIPAASSYYKLTSSITRTNRCSVRGEGQASHIHYTGTGTGLTMSDARFSVFTNWYLTGTSSANAGGVYFKNAQGGLVLMGFMTDGFTGTSGWNWRFSDSWDVTVIGGCARQARKGVWCDTTDLGQGGINNQIQFLSVDMTECETSVDFQAGQGLYLLGCDFGNGGAVVAPLRAVEFGRALTGTKFADSCTITGCWFEGTGSGVAIGRGNTSSATPSKVVVEANHMDVSSEMLRISKGDLCVIGENGWGSGSITIDAGVTRTVVKTVNSLTDNSTAGQTTYVRQSSVEAPSIVARGDLQSGMNRLRVHRNGTDQTGVVTGTPTKIQWTTEALDSPAAFDNATNYRWTPTKAGWYLCRSQVTMNGLADQNLVQLTLRKNGSRVALTNFYASKAANHTVAVEQLVQFNGSTDYLEVWVEHDAGSNKDVEGDADSSYLEAFPQV